MKINIDVFYKDATEGKCPCQYFYEELINIRIPNQKFSREKILFKLI